MVTENKKLIIAVSVLVGSCIGAGVLGIPYVAAQAGFFVAIAYILLIGALVLTTNLYLGEVVLRTKGMHQIPGYVKKYLGKKWKSVAEFAMVFGIYSAIVAYMLGMGESLSFIFFSNVNYSLLFGVLVGLGMSSLLWKGIRGLKKFEKIGVTIILILIAIIFFVFVQDVNISNLYTFNKSNIFLPFGVILFALLSFHAIPEIKAVLRKDEKLLKKSIIIGALISVIFYIIFTLIVVGVKGIETPEVATISLGKIFVLLGIFTMFTSYLALGNALEENLMYDKNYKKKKAWFITAIIPIAIFFLTQLTNFFSFTKILGIGGVISGGLTGILILLMNQKSKKSGDKTPKYKIPINKIIIWILSLIFVAGIVFELFL